MVRAVIALVVVILLAAGALAIAGPLDLGGADAPGTDASLVGASDSGVYPGLRAVEEIGAPGGGPRDSGVGVYPALTGLARLRFPDVEALRSARDWLAARQGHVTFAVADARGGVSGVGARRRYRSASLSKAMILVAFLRRLEAVQREPSSFERLSLGYMIGVSDNVSADSIYRRVGDAGLREVARSAGMQDFQIAGDWANATVTAADQARLFFSLDRLVPARFLPLAKEVLETVSPLHTWGIPRVSRPRWRTFFKGGWRPEAGAEVVHQAALLESGATQVALAIMTGDNPSMAYGERTIEGLARRLLAGSDAALVPTVPLGGGVVPGELTPLGDLHGFHPAEPPTSERLRD